MQGPKVSIVIPAYNEEKYIEKTLVAVLAQDYPNFEVIVVDNVSTDNTCEIVRKFKEVKLISENKKGPNAARETGRKISTGEFIATIDADTLLPKNWISSGTKYFKDQKIVAVSGPYRFYDSNFLFSIASFIVQDVFFTLTNFLTQYVFKNGGVVTGGGALIKASSLEKVGGFNTDIEFYGDDADSAMRLSKIGKIIYSSNFYTRSSARRFKRIGYIKTFIIYVNNFLSIVRTGKPSGEINN